jgi:hypothetical protein
MRKFLILTAAAAAVAIPASAQAQRAPAAVVVLSIPARFTATAMPAGQRSRSWLLRPRHCKPGSKRLPMSFGQKPRRSRRRSRR